MAKTYTAAGSATAGEVYTASAHNVIVTNVNNFIVPPSVRVDRTTNLTGYSSTAAIAWSGEVWDTDDMYTSGTSTTNITIQTAGIYVISFLGLVSGTATISRVLPQIRIGGTTTVQGESIVGDSGTTSSFNISTTESLSVGNVITATVQFVGGSAYIINGAAAPSNSNTRLTVTWIGRTS
jgi:hypothetical protein